jgi:hypothetical protein
MRAAPHGAAPPASPPSSITQNLLWIVGSPGCLQAELGDQYKLYLLENQEERPVGGVLMCVWLVWM